MKCLMIFSLILSIPAIAIEPLDNYYSEDLLDAVTQAKEQPHHYDYSNSYRYKRTTAQSIELNRLDLNELDDTRLSVNTGKKEKGNSLEISNSQISSNPQDQDRSNLETMDSINTVFNNTAPLESSYKNSAGSYRATGIVQSGTVISMPRQ